MLGLIFFSFTFLLFSLVKNFFLVGSILKISYAKKVNISLFQQPVSSFIVISVDLFIEKDMMVICFSFSFVVVLYILLAYVWNFLN